MDLQKRFCQDQIYVSREDPVARGAQLSQRNQITRQKTG